MSKKTKTDETSHTVTTPTNPEWATSAIQGLSGDVAKLGELDPASLIAGSNPLIDQGAAGAAGLTSGTGYTDAGNQIRSVLSMAAPTVKAESLLENLDAYKNPFINDVVNTSLADFDQNAGATRAQQALDLGRSGAFGGSGSALAIGETEGQLARGRGALDSGLRYQALDSAMGYSNLDAGRRQDAGSQTAQLASQNIGQRLQGAGMLGDLTSAQGANDRANIGTQTGLGDILRQIEQQRLQAPITLAGQRAGITSQLPYNLFNGQVQDGTRTGTTTTSDPLGTLGTLALGAGSLFAAPLTGGLSLGGLGGLFGGAAKGIGALKAISGARGA